ncbi:MAG: molybdopterin-dependent oxidoreductase [Anaerolineales bacterium]|nr:molybdopterin-dependent oxidoreductase [Anaerolineales bacterium]MCX7755167.1 molybdopterin-dependent oxidoreductase [Anaerolineales bacterium]MDW8277833.1 molybdopterin cofactor-binding domain-containing protein [Anaerolineales bacterium]
MTTIIGTAVPRIDAYGKVTGQTEYSGDLVMPGMLHAKILFAGRPHARILSIDTSAAEALPGVVAIFTAKDVPVNEYGLQINDQPVLCGPNSPLPAGEGTGVRADIVRFVGDQVALIVAETEAIADQARKLIRVEYEDLPVLTDPEEAMKPGAFLIHPERGTSNICVHDKIRKGDVEKGFAEADVIVEAEYRVPMQEHAYLQPEAGLAYVDENGLLTVKAAGQWTHVDRKQIAHALALPEEQVRVQYPAIGGAFGGREDMSIQIVIALAAWKLKRPVKIIWSRQESIIGHAKRHAMVIRAKWGARKDGKLTAARNLFIADGGAYMYTTNKVLGNSTITESGPYFIPNIEGDVIGVYTNNVPAAAFRGFGAPQAAFMAESQMNKLAEKLGMDPVEIRRINALKETDTMAVGTLPPNKPTVLEVIEAAAEKFGWEQGAVSRNQGSVNSHRAAVKRGRGFAAGFKNIGFSFGYKENCWARVEIHGQAEIEAVTVWCAAAEVGQGNHTILAQIAAEVTGVPLSRVNLLTMDTLNMGNAGSASASRLTVMSGNAVKGAAESALEKWKNEERPAVAEYTYLAPPTTPLDPETGYCTPNFLYAYAAQAVEVEVDTETGHVRLLRVVSAHDVGKAINPDLVVGQIEGGIVQAQGYVIQENFITRGGYVLTDQLSTYLIPTIWDIPAKVESVLVEIPAEIGPWGAKGVGELPYLPLAPAITAAIHDATGVWIDQFPLTPERVLRALGKL